MTAMIGGTGNHCFTSSHAVKIAWKLVGCKVDFRVHRGIHPGHETLNVHFDFAEALPAISLILIDVNPIATTLGRRTAHTADSGKNRTAGLGGLVST